MAELHAGSQEHEHEHEHERSSSRRLSSLISLSWHADGHPDDDATVRSSLTVTAGFAIPMSEHLGWAQHGVVLRRFWRTFEVFMEAER